MSKPKTYQCGICETKPDSISHHKSHIESQKHKDKKELYSLKIEKLSKDDLALEMGKYKAKTTADLVLRIESIVSPNNTEMEDEIIEASNIIIAKTAISNKDALRDKIHEIHNFIRNNGGGYGMTALKMFNILYGLMRIEQNNLLEKLDLKLPECRFSYLVGLANDKTRNLKDDKLASVIFNDVIDSIYDGKLYDFLYYEIPRNIKSNIFSYLINEINSLSELEKTYNVQLSGKVYEYFVGRDDTAISEMGAYFSDRHLTNYTLRQVNPKIQENGEIHKMADMFGGSGGFTLEYVNYMISQNNKINWSKEISKIYHFDMNADVVKSAALETFCLTGEIPGEKNFQYKNSFTDEFNDEKYYYIFTNPPYGGDKNEKSDTKIKRDKIKKFIEEELKTCKDEKIILKRKQQLLIFKKEEDIENSNAEKNKVSVDNCSHRIRNYAKNNKLTGNDKESASLILIMSLLEKNGTAAPILKEGVIFNKNYKKIRECLIKNFNVRKVISVPSDQFENTTTKTSILIFDNTENKTERVEFYNLIVDKYKEDKFEEINDFIVISESKGDIKEVRDELVSVATFDELKNNKEWSLNGKEYKVKTIKINNDYEMVNMVSLCEFLPRSKKSGSFGKEVGKYNYYTSSEKVQKCDDADYNEECLIIGTGGSANIKIDDNFSCSISNYILKSPYSKYIYYLLHENKNFMSDLFKGTTQDNLTKGDLSKIEIPIPKDREKIDIIVKVISEKQNKLKEIQNDIIDYEKNISDAIDEIINNYDCNDIELKNLCEIEYGKRIVKDKTTPGDYPVYGGGGITFTSNNYNREGFNILISRFAMSEECVRLIYEKFYLNDSGLTIKTMKNELIKYLGYYLLKKQKDIYELTRGSIQLNINIDNFKNYKIKIPKDSSILDELTPVFDEIQRLKQEEKIVELEYQELLKNMSKEIIISF